MWNTEPFEAPRIPDFYFQVPEFTFQTHDFLVPISHLRFPISDFGFQIFQNSDARGTGLQRPGEPLGRGWGNPPGRAAAPAL